MSRSGTRSGWSGPADPGGEAEGLNLLRSLPDQYSHYNKDMQTLPLSTVKARLSELVDAASVTHDQVVITKNGVPAAVIIGSDEWEALQETLYWLSEPNIREDLARAKEEITAGRGLTEEQIRAEFGVPKR